MNKMIEHSVIFTFQSFHAELHQFKQQIELFKQLTQRLISVYQNEDTSRFKKVMEHINQHYSRLDTWFVVCFKYILLFAS